MRNSPQAIFDRSTAASDMLTCTDSLTRKTNYNAHALQHTIHATWQGFLPEILIFAVSDVRLGLQSFLTLKFKVVSFLH
jgi:hypothetical protein